MWCKLIGTALVSFYFGYLCHYFCEQFKIRTMQTECARQLSHNLYCKNCVVCHKFIDLFGLDD